MAQSIQRVGEGHLDQKLPMIVLADVGTRLIPTGSELKLGVLTSLIGTPFFFWLVVRLRKMAP